MPSEAEKDTGEPNEDVYEFVLPPGIPSKVIIAACKEFNTDVVSAYVDVDKETIEKIRKFVIEETRKFINE
jgi:hypothetical protein